METKKRILIHAMLFTFIFACSDKIIEKPFISPPFPHLNQTYTDFSFNAEKGDTLVFNTGSRIIVPPDIWVDSTGNKISGTIKIKYREFSDAGDVFLAGIPLNYDTAGRAENLVTAGMFELRSFKDAKEIFIDKNKSLTVQLASKVDNADYNFYYLDEKAENWEYMGYSEPMVNPKIKEIKDSIEMMKPMPFPFDNSYFALNYEAVLDIYYKENRSSIKKNYKSNLPKSKAQQYGLSWSGIYGWQELRFNGISYAAYQMVWQKPDGKRLPGIAKDCYVEKLTPLGNNLYSMTLKSGNKTAVIQVKAVMPLKHLFAYPPETWKQKYDQILEEIKLQEQRLAMQFAVYRSFDITATGFHNWDKVYNRQDKILVKGNFEFDRDIEEVMSDIEIYYFIENNKSFIKISYSSADSLMLVPDSSAKLIAVLSEKEAAFFSSQDYNKINFNQLKTSSNPTYLFKMKTVEIGSKEDFNNLITMN